MSDEGRPTLLSRTEFGDVDGPPIVALHGGAMTGNQWARIGTEGLPTRRWICPDARGHGESLSDPPWTVSQMARDVIDTVDSMAIESFDIIGHSMGGRVAIEVCRIAPDRVRSAVLLDPPVMTSEECREFNARKSEARGGVRQRLLTAEDLSIDEVISALAPGSSMNDRRFVEQEVRALLSASTSGTFRLRCRKVVIDAIAQDICRNIPPQFGAFSGCVLLLIAKLFNACTEQGYLALRSQLGDRLFTVGFEDAGHHVLLDSYEETLSAVRGFLAREGLPSEEHHEGSLR